MKRRMAKETSSMVPSTFQSRLVLFTLVSDGNPRWDRGMGGMLQRSGGVRLDEVKRRTNGA